MIINIPNKINKFCKLFNRFMTKWQRKIIPRMITGMLTAYGDPNIPSGDYLQRRIQREGAYIAHTQKYRASADWMMSQ